MNVINFLTPDLESIKHQIHGIDDSYSHEWDVLAELCQNSIDAIKMSDNREGIISIIVDAQKKSISVQDNGIGISPDQMPRLLKPFASSKVSNFAAIGEKGVGLTFVIFSSNNFSIKSGNNEGVSEGHIINAHSWKSSTSNEELPLEFRNIDEDFEGTLVTIEGVEDSPLFELNFDQLKQIIRTKTAIGSTLSIWGDDRNITIDLSFTDINGVRHSEEDLPFRYQLPYETMIESVVDYDDFMSFASNPQRTDHDKRNYLRHKIVIKKGTFTRSNNREIKYMACFVPSRSTWDKLSVASGLASEENIESEDWKTEYGYTLFSSGIFTSVKGMPTGITIDPPSTGYAGYWSNMFVIFEDPQLNFDIGRKSLPGRQVGMIRDYAKDVFNDYLRIIKYISGEAEIVQEWDKQELLDEISTIPDLNYQNVRMIKTPKDQEASVAAIFYECIGSGLLTELQPVTSGYKGKYDLVVKWGRKYKILEFKSRLKNIVKDFNDAVKLFNEMDCIVCWDISEDDKEELSRKLAVDVEEIHVNPLAPEQSQNFPNATHKLTLSGFTAPIFVIDLKHILDRQE